jgi:hypothetical protein
VYEAVQSYLDSARPADDGWRPEIEDAVEWVRRSLALNRGAVFAALLLRGDDRINEKLLPLRLTLSADDVATVCRRAACEPCERSRAFLREWHDLVSAEVTAQAGDKTPADEHERRARVPAPGRAVAARAAC